MKAYKIRQELPNVEVSELLDKATDKYRSERVHYNGGIKPHGKALKILPARKSKFIIIKFEFGNEIVPISQVKLWF